jgi:hypothetical protein
VTGVTQQALPMVLQEMRDLKAKRAAADQFFEEDDNVLEAQVQELCRTADDAFMTIDIRKSYATAYTCSIYEGFPTKLTDLRPVETFEAPGFYLIDQIDLSGTSPAFKQCLSVLGNPFLNLNVWTRPDLVLLQREGVKFVVLEGCYAQGARPSFDMRFPGDPTEGSGFFRKDDDGVPYYSKYAGACNQINYHKTFWMNGSKEYFENMASYLEEGTSVRTYHEGAAQIEFKRKSVKHLSHITAYLNAYERIRIIDQLLEVFRAGNSEADVIWIDKDDITLRRNKPFRIMPFMREGSTSSKSFCNEQVSCYVSNLWQQEADVYPFQPVAASADMRPGSIVAYVGAGGDGKTHTTLCDSGYCGVLYVAPSYDLLEAKMEEYNVKGAVKDVALGPDFHKTQHLQRNFSVMVWDEISEFWMETVQKILQVYPYHRHILCGDPGYQLPPIKTMKETSALTPLTVAALQSARFAEFDDLAVNIYRSSGYSYRCKCERLREVLTRLREMIDNKCTEKQMAEYVMGILRPLGQVISFEECIEKFAVEDAILVTRTSDPDYVAEYTDILKERQFFKDGQQVKRFRVLPNAPLPNGRIVIAPEKPFEQCVERYASSVHAFQGKTSLHVTFIDNRRMFEPQHWYTALSRAQYLANVFVVDVPICPSQEYRKTLIYRIASPNTDLVYIGHTTKTLTKRFEGHMRDFEDTAKKKRCSSDQVIKHGQPFIDLIEEYPCGNKQEAKAREAWWIERTPQSVNKNVPGGKRKRE